ncbi:MAG: DUF4129 domain-containing protein [Sphingobacteriales bacterium]|nr:MAG: DUF4129 domain-containing protein [Sphingobacteriales bacterium]
MKYVRNLIPFIFITCLLLLAVDNICFADTVVVTDEQWQELANDKAFSYAGEKETVEQINQQEPNIFTSGLMSLISFFSSSFGRVLIWTVFFVFIAWILFKVFSNQGLFAPRSQKLSDDEPMPTPNHEDDLLLADWEKRMQHAMKAGDMAMAIKYSYLHLLKLLQQKDLISFRSDKTNYEYYHELRDATYRKPFKQLTNQYEYIWYGKYPVSEQQYSEYMSTFNTLKAKLA